MKTLIPWNSMKVTLYEHWQESYKKEFNLFLSCKKSD